MQCLPPMKVNQSHIFSCFGLGIELGNSMADNKDLIIYVFVLVMQEMVGTNLFARCQQVVFHCLFPVVVTSLE